jgi:Baseplate J-like protein
MSSPGVIPPIDLTGYVDLRLYDVSDQDIVDTAIAAAQLNLPGWIPNEANTEVIIMEALALEIAEAIVAVNRLPGAVAVAILGLIGVTRDLGAPPVATATITFGDLLGHIVPAGTRIHLQLADGSTVTFLVEPPGLTVAPGIGDGVVSLIGDTYTSAANGTPLGTVLAMADRLPFVDSVVLATAVADGRSPETDNEWRDRGVDRLSRLSEALVLPRHFTAAALEDPLVGIAMGLDSYDPGVGSGVPGDHPGHMTVAVLDEAGTPLSAPAKAALELSMETSAVAMLDVHVMDATIVTVPVATTVVPIAGTVWATVQASVIASIQAYIDPIAWSERDGGPTIYLNEMISLIDQVSGVDRVVTVTLNGVGANYAIAGITALPNAGVITVTQGP